jgi:hypothetical protein
LADRSSSKDRPDGSGPSAAGSAGSSGTGAPGLGEQFGRTRKALFGLVGAHVELAKAEFAEIIDEIKRAAILGAGALALLIASSSFLLFGLILWLGEAIFGSIGWGVLLGTELLIGVAVLLVLAIIDFGPRRWFAAFVVALGLGLVVFGVLAFDWSALSRQSPGLAAGLIAVAVGAVVVGFVAAVLASPFGRGLASAAFVGGAVIGALLGLLGWANPGLRVAAAIGVATLLLFLPIVSAVLVFRHGIDTAKLKDRFVPDQTIATTKETIEWVREQMPLGPKQ